MITMNTAQEAVAHVLATHKITKYRLAMNLGVTPSMINRYLDGHNMSKVVAEKLLRHYGIEVTVTREVGRLK